MKSARFPLVITLGGILSGGCTPDGLTRDESGVFSESLASTRRSGAVLSATPDDYVRKYGLATAYGDRPSAAGDVNGDGFDDRAIG